MHRHGYFDKPVDRVIFGNILPLDAFYYFLGYDNLVAVYVKRVLMNAERLVNDQDSSVVNIGQQLKLLINHLVCIILQIPVSSYLVSQNLRLGQNIHGPDVNRALFIAADNKKLHKQHRRDSKQQKHEQKPEFQAFQIVPYLLFSFHDESWSQTFPFLHIPDRLQPW